MRLAIIFIMCAATTASAEPWSFDMPAGFKEKAGEKDPFVEQAREAPGTISVDATVLVNGDVQLTRIVWRLKLATALTRNALDEFDKKLLAASPYAAERVSAVPVWYGEQMVVDAFEMADAPQKPNRTRVYHRRFYAADRSGVVHVFWLVCTGPADKIGSCEQAQQTMRLALPDEAPLPQGEQIVQPSRPYGPWSFVLPQGYVEVKEATATLLSELRGLPAQTGGDARVYQSPAGDVVLVAMTITRYPSVRLTQADVIGFAKWLVDWTDERSTKRIHDSQRVEDDVLVADRIDEVGTTTLHQRHVIGVDAIRIVYAFSTVCLGPRDKLAECEAAQASMQLTVPNQIDVKTLREKAPAKRRGVGKWSISNVLGGAASIALLVGLTKWILDSARRGSRRRRRR